MSRPPSREAAKPVADPDTSTLTAPSSSPAPHPTGSESPIRRGQQRPPTWVPLPPIPSQVSMFTGRSTGDPIVATPLSPKSDDGKAILSPGSIDRVFPARSAISIDPVATPMPRMDSSSGYPGMSVAARQRASSHTVSGPRPVPTTRTASVSDASEIGSISDAAQRSVGSIPQATGNLDHKILANMVTDDAVSRKSEASSISGGVPIPAQQGTGLVTARFKHVVTDEGHAVITGRDGETLQRCEDEPIHIPGAIQSFGLLIAFREENEKLVVRIASENSAKIIGYTPQQLFKIESFLDIFSEEQADNLLDHIDFIREEGAGDVASTGPDVFMVSIKPPHSRTRRLWCAMHLSETDAGLIICEFELEDDTTNPLVPPEDRVTPEFPEDTLGSQPTHEELMDSTVNISKPLRVLRSARKKRTEAAAMEVFNIMSQVQEQLATAPTLQTFLKVLIGIVKELTGFHRVMIYQFDHSWNGRVVAELVDPRATKDLYKGLNFPASDIPKQARDLYKINKVRLLYDRDQETSRLVCRTLEDLERPLDMTHANLRAMSPIHIKYLANMGVRSSMSISISAFNELWGLISCHSYGARGMRVSFPIRKMCRLVGDTASRNVERLSYASRLQARKLINTSSTATNPSGYIVASSDDLLKLFEADLGALSIRDETKILGNPRGHLQEVLAMVEYLRMRRMSAVFCSQDFSSDFPDLRYDPGWKFLAGVLFVPLSTGGNDFIAFFRRGVLQEVKWAGNPYEKFVKEGTEGYLEPRTSFKQWTETIVGRCRDWTDEEIETASVLCLVYGKFIEVWRQKEAALQNSQLTRLLLANSAHEVRTPLNAIINYLEIAMEGALDQDTRENLARSHSASKSLVYVINDLLDLTKTEGGQTLVKDEPFNLLQTIKDATNPFIGDARRKNLEYEVEISPSLPRSVLGDHRRVRQVVSNLIANAVQHTKEGKVIVEAYPCPTAQPQPGKTEIEIVVEDSGAGMSQAKVDALFKELEEVSYEEDLPESKAVITNPVPDQPQSENATLGLGLALVARTIRNMNGQLRVKTEEGKGSRFVIVLGFDTDGSDPAQLAIQPMSPDLSTRPATSSGQQEGEVTLIYRNPQKGPESLGSRPAPPPRRASAESMNSLASLKSAMSLKSDASRKSDADRLIDAIQQPLQFADQKTSSPAPTHDEAFRRRSLESPSKSKSLPSPRDLKSALRTGGWEKVKDSGTPLRPVRVPDDQEDEASGSKIGPRILFREPRSECSQSDTTEISKANPADNFSVLVAEDDPINSKIMKKRLEKLGHAAHMTVNGEECSSAFGEQPASFDAILMDLQMPIVDGFSSTKMIRSYEKTQGKSCLSSRAGQNGRVPIFAVSASLVEKERNKYVETGFDGWILKPVDFKRVDLLLKGIVDEEARNECLYQPGKWERGGWFSSREKQHDSYDVDTHPSQEKPTSVPGPASTSDEVQAS
ncbi:phytochrome-like histidine kinase PHY1p [Cladophialophora carrionii]|uniref:Phytochrome-like histidine kinase PHY1p n=1 Tax=Cladophialophora carrionii TaxID=86049 RepID=A0A1C1CCY7_9EURO|nr:phytochrome-like histidine kinase PHY1p [Cladophialophora carrionii]